MGYRSQVRSIIYGEPDVVQAFWTKHKLAGNTALMPEGFGGVIRRYNVRLNTPSNSLISVIDLSGDNWKWYDDCPDVAGWMQLLQDVDKLDNDLMYEFVRIGEETDDIVYDCSSEQCYWFLGVHSTIVCDIPTKVKEETNEQDAESQG